MTTLVQQINDVLEKALAELALDPRLCFTRVAAAPPDARELIVESSDSQVLQRVAAAVGVSPRGATTGAPVSAAGSPLRLVLLPDDAGALPEGLVAASSVVDVRREPSHTSELRTQIVYGDPVVPLKEEGEWVLVRLDDGYVGWIRDWHLAAVSPAEQQRYGQAARFRVAVNHAEVLVDPSGEALPVSDVVIGTHIIAKACGIRGWRRVALADGREGYMRARSLERAPRPGRVSRERLASTGLRFLGIPYIWGGTTPKGFDCSGLIQRIFRLNGVLIPRDADMQSRWGREREGIEPEGLDTGDLLFFGASPERITHVAMMLSDGLFLHAYGQVRVGSLDPRHRLYEAKLHRIWRSSRDPLSPLST